VGLEYLQKGRLHNLPGPLLDLLAEAKSSQSSVHEHLPSPPAGWDSSWCAGNSDDHQRQIHIFVLSLMDCSIARYLLENPSWLKKLHPGSTAPVLLQPQDPSDTQVLAKLPGLWSTASILY